MKYCQIKMTYSPMVTLVVKPLPPHSSNYIQLLNVCLTQFCFPDIGSGGSEVQGLPSLSLSATFVTTLGNMRSLHMVQSHSSGRIPGCFSYEEAPSWRI